MDLNALTILLLNPSQGKCLWYHEKLYRTDNAVIVGGRPWIVQAGVLSCIVDYDKIDYRYGISRVFARTVPCYTSGDRLYALNKEGDDEVIDAGREVLAAARAPDTMKDIVLYRRLVARIHQHPRKIDAKAIGVDYTSLASCTDCVVALLRPPTAPAFSIPWDHNSAHVPEEEDPMGLLRELGRLPDAVQDNLLARKERQNPVVAAQLLKLLGIPAPKPSNRFRGYNATECMKKYTGDNVGALEEALTQEPTTQHLQNLLIFFAGHD